MRLTHPALKDQPIDVPERSVASLKRRGWKAAASPKSPAKADEKAPATDAPEGAATPREGVTS